MKNWIMNALFAATLATPVAACALHGDDADELSENTAELASCCSGGAYSCPSNPDLDSFDYAPPRCGAPTKPGAKRACERACDVTCVDTGWSSSC